jgi:hypothetical protein
MRWLYGLALLCIVLFVVGAILVSSGGTEPPERGEGDPIEQPR